MEVDAIEHFWRGLEERDDTPAFRASTAGEFPGTREEMDAILADAKAGHLDRRAFLRAAGFTLGGGMALSSCSRGVEEKLVPLLVRSEGTTPGRTAWYATTCGGCSAGCGLLVKSRDGRPIKIEGNPEHPLSRGGVCPVGQAAVLGVYDSERLAGPIVRGSRSATVAGIERVDWERIDSEITARLKDIQGTVVFLTGTITSPTTRALIEKFLARFESSLHVTYDAVSCASILEAHELTFGQRVLPHYRFDRADLVVSFDADFLGTWISPVEFTKDWIARRSPERTEEVYGRHIQLEGRLSLSGSNADQRIRVSPREAAWILDRLAGDLAARAAVSKPDFGLADDGAAIDEGESTKIAAALWESRGRSLVISGSGDVREQCAVNFINEVLGNYGHSLDTSFPSHQRDGDDEAFEHLVTRMRVGAIGALFIAGTNPAYSLPDAHEFVAALARVPLTVAFAEHVDETAELCHYVLPTPHFLASWGDAEIVSGLIGVAQPLIAPLERSRTVRESLARWMGDARTDLELIRAHWKAHVLPLGRPHDAEKDSFQGFWDRSVHDGFALVERAPLAQAHWRHPFELASLASSVAPKFAPSIPPSTEPRARAASHELVLYPKLAMLDGSQAYNAWLHELPDPITKVVWDNYVCLAPATARELKVETGDVVRVTAGEAALELPALIQPGQHTGVVAIAVGYGRKGTDRFSRIGPKWIFGKETVAAGGTVGVNAYGLGRRTPAGVLLANRVALERTGAHVELAFTQTHHTMSVPESLGGEKRDPVRQTTLAAYRQDPASGNPRAPELVQLWKDDHPYEGHHWGLAIDLNRCTGCSACIIACQVENNVPVVGKDEVLKRREMHWIRIDRYYAGGDEDVDVVHQPMMCQHCGNAPCETVCPTLATVHSSEGLNSQIYNRCVGTRYCANNCPYKVRRFNWFEYRTEEKRENLALNPDVTTRSRGVMEKCSLCVQRIQEAKAEAVRRGAPLADGAIQTACQQSCPGDAIVFGDMNDPKSRVAARKADARHYHVLEELNVRPSVGYLTKVRNREST